MKKHLVTFISALLAVTAILALVVALNARILLLWPVVIPEQGLVYTVEAGKTLNQVARDWEDKGYLRSKWALILIAKLNGRAHRIYAGEYHFNANSSVLDIANHLASGDVVQHALALIEGWTVDDVLEAIASSPYFEHQLKGLDHKSIIRRLGIQETHLEGLFYPDTYFYYKGMSDVAFLRRAYCAMQSKLQTLWTHRAENLPIKTPYEALILASIIEKETPLVAERPEVSGVLVRRLQKGMLLQTDPTVIYGIGRDFDGDLTKKHLIQDTPYNSYTRAGLPPTPIAMPSEASIFAALHPASGKALYYVANGTGGHQFSNTLSEHTRAVRRYQLKRD